MEQSIGLKEQLVGEGRTWIGRDEGALLAAALAAVLVEYRRHVGQTVDPAASEGTGPNWRLMARWQHLRG